MSSQNRNMQKKMTNFQPHFISVPENGIKRWNSCRLENDPLREYEMREVEYVLFSRIYSRRRKESIIKSLFADVSIKENQIKIRI